MNALYCLWSCGHCNTLLDYHQTMAPLDQNNDPIKSVTSCWEVHIDTKALMNYTTKRLVTKLQRDEPQLQEKCDLKQSTKQVSEMAKVDFMSLIDKSYEFLSWNIAKVIITGHSRTDPHLRYLRNSINQVSRMKVNCLRYKHRKGFDLLIKDYSINICVSMMPISFVFTVNGVRIKNLSRTLLIQ